MHKKVILFVALCIWVVMGFAQKTKMTVHEYIEMYQDLAVSEMERAGIPASITLAQGILESSNGNSRLATDGNNHFGIKCKKNWTGTTIYADDDELHECFRGYPTAKDSYIDHSTFLLENNRYAFLFDLEPNDYKGWAHGLKKAGYATNPKYADILISLIERHELHKLDKKERIKHNKPKDSPVPDAPKPDPILQKKSDFFKFNGILATKVIDGQNPTSIAQAYNLRPKQLYKYNDLNEGSDVVPGTIVYLKPKHRKGSEAYHTVAVGETMHSISQAYGIKLKHLYKKNRMEAGTEPAIGQVVYMRRKRRTPPELRQAGDEIALAVPAPASKQPEYKEQPAVIIAPNNSNSIDVESVINQPKTQETQEVDIIQDKKTKPVKETKKEPEYVEKERGGNSYDVTIEEKNKELSIDKKQLDNVEYHTVQAGETLFAISRKYGKSVDQLKQLNNLSDYTLSVGQKLIINENFKEKQPDTESTNFYHEVQKGETLYAIAKKYNMGVDEIKQLNNLGDVALSVGQKLMVSKATKPQSKTTEAVTTNFVYHTVEKGETLYAISRKYSVKVDDIKKLNNLGDAAISVGQKLRVK